MQQRSLFIYGGCATRDALPYYEEFGFKLAGYVARQSLISSMSRSPLNGWDFSNVTSKFQQRMLRGDVVGNLIGKISECQPQHLVWDLNIERVGVSGLSNGKFITRGTWSRGTPPKGLSKEFDVPFSSDQHFQLWKKSLRIFKERLEPVLPLESIIVNATPQATVDESGNTELKHLKEGRKFNSIIAKYHQFLTAEGFNVVHPDESKVVSRTNGHKWGPAAFHYIDDTYQHSTECIIQAFKE